MCTALCSFQPPGPSMQHFICTTEQTYGTPRCQLMLSSKVQCHTQPCVSSFTAWTLTRTVSFNSKSVYFHHTVWKRSHVPKSDIWTTTLHHLIDSVRYWLDANFPPWGPLLKLARFPAPKSHHLVLQEQLLPSLWPLELNSLFNLLMHFKTSRCKWSQLWIWQYSEVSQCHSLGWAKCQVTE